MKKMYLIKAICTFIVCLQLILSAGIITHAYNSECDAYYKSTSPHNIHEDKNGDD